MTRRYAPRHRAPASLWPARAVVVAILATGAVLGMPAPCTSSSAPAGNFNPAATLDVSQVVAP